MASIGLLLAAAPAAFSAPVMNTAGDIATYTTSQNIGSVVNGKYVPQGVPAKWKKIVIEKNVTLTGRFDFPRRDTNLIFEGKDPNTSIIKGWKRSEDALAEDKAGIHRRDYNSAGTLEIKNLKIQDQPGRGIMGWGKGNLTVTSCNIVNTVDEYWGDGVHCDEDGDLTYCTINVKDDGTYATMCDYINNVKFTHNKNGAPIQIGWGDSTGGGKEKTVTNCTFAGNYNANYNCGTVDWKKSKVNNDSIKLKMSGTSWYKNSGAIDPYKFSFGHNTDTKYVTVGAKIQVNGWTWNNTTQVRKNTTSTGSVVSY